MFNEKNVYAVGATASKFRFMGILDKPEDLNLKETLLIVLDTPDKKRIDGVDEWYGNIENVNVKLYDYVSKGELLGDCNNYLYLVYKKDGKVLNYEEYLK